MVEIEIGYNLVSLTEKGEEGDLLRRVYGTAAPGRGVGDDYQADPHTG